MKVQINNSLCLPCSNLKDILSQMLASFRIYVIITRDKNGFYTDVVR